MLLPILAGLGIGAGQGQRHRRPAKSDGNHVCIRHDGAGNEPTATGRGTLAIHFYGAPQPDDVLAINGVASERELDIEDALSASEGEYPVHYYRLRSLIHVLPI